MVAERRTTGHRSSNETHPEGMTEIMILAPIVRVRSQVSTQTGGGVPLTTGYLLKLLRDESQRCSELSNHFATSFRGQCLENGFVDVD